MFALTLPSTEPPGRVPTAGWPAARLRLSFITRPPISRLPSAHHHQCRRNVVAPNEEGTGASVTSVVCLCPCISFTTRLDSPESATAYVLEDELVVSFLSSSIRGIIHVATQKSDGVFISWPDFNYGGVRSSPNRGLRFAHAGCHRILSRSSRPPGFFF